LSIDTGKAGPSRAGRADWILLGSWDRKRFFDCEIHSEMMHFATELMEQSGLIQWPSPESDDDDVERLGLWQFCEEVWKGGDTTQKIFRCPLHKRCGCPLKLRITRSPSSSSLEFAGGEHTQARCHQTNNSAGKGATEKWTLVAEYPTASGMATDVPDIVDAMYHHVEDFMHAGGLRMDENHVGSPTDFHMWRLEHETTRSMYWNCPMKWLCGCTAGIRIMETPNTLRLEKTGRHDEDSHRLVRKKVAMSARSTSREAAGIKPAVPGDGWSSSDSEDGCSSSDDSGAVILRCDMRARFKLFSLQMTITRQLLLLVRRVPCLRSYGADADRSVWNGESNMATGPPPNPVTTARGERPARRPARCSCFNV
jgi:hypothetical protein